MGNDTGAEPRGGFKVVGAGETPEDAGNPQTAGEASEPGKQPRALRPRIIVLGLGGAGGNAVHNMIEGQLEGVELFVANTDSQALETSICDHRLQLGRELTGGLGAGGRPEVGRAAAEESLDEVLSAVSGASLVFIAAGMGGGTGTGSAPVVAEAIRKKGVLTVAVVTKPFRFEGEVRMEVAEQGISALEKHVDTLIVIPNQNLFKIATEKTSVSDAFHRADNVLFAGVRGVTDLMVKPGLINLDFADFRSVMTQTGKAIMGAGEADGPQRAVNAAEAAMANPLLEDSSVDGARGVLINVTGGRDLTLFELDEAVESVRTAAHPKANIIVGSAFDEGLEGKIRVSVLATGILPKQAKAPAAKAEGGDTATATTTKSAEPTVKADEPGPQAAAPKAGAGAAAAPAKASAHAAEAAQVAERPAESAASAQAGPPTQPEASAPTTAKAEDSAKAATPGAAPPAADEPAQAEAKKPDQPAGASPQAPVSEATPAKTATAKAETPPPPEPAEAKAMPTPATAEPEASTPAEPTIAAPEAKHADAETKVPSVEAPKAEAAPAKAPPAETPAKAEAEAPAKVPAGDRRLTLEDILRRAEQAMETQKAAEAAAAEKTAEAPTPPAPEPAAETSPPPAPEPVAKAEAQPAAPAPEPAADIEAQPAASEPEPAPAEAAPDDDANLDALIDEVLIRNRKAADFEPKEPSLQIPPAGAPEGPEAGGTSTDALLEDLAFSLASDDPFVLDESAAVRGTEDKDLEALFGAAAAETAVPAGEAAESAPMPPPDPAPSLEEDSDDAFQAELDRRARERARAALEALSEPSGESKAKPKPEEEDSDEALREIMNIPSFLRRTDD